MSEVEPTVAAGVYFAYVPWQSSMTLHVKLVSRAGQFAAHISGLCTGEDTGKQAHACTELPTVGWRVQVEEHHCIPQSHAHVHRCIYVHACPFAAPSTCVPSSMDGATSYLSVSGQYPIAVPSSHSRQCCSRSWQDPAGCGCSGEGRRQLCRPATVTT